MTAPRETFPHVRRFLAEVPWAILPSALDALVEVVDRRFAGIELSDAEITEKIGAARRLPRQSAVPGSIAVLPIQGTLFPRANLLTDVSGAASYESLGSAFDALVNDPNVSAIVLDIDSPGGSVQGLEELAAKIYGARGTKPVVAVANHLVASAAYYLASQADEIVVSPSALVGSIGTVGIHQETSAADEKAGIRTTIVTAGKHKFEGNSLQPLGEEARAELQRKIDAYYGEFVRAVAVGRNVSQTKVREEFGQGRLLMAEDAVAVGMADREATLEQTIARLSAKAQSAAGPRAELAPGVDGVALTEKGWMVTSEDSVAIDRERLRLAVELAGEGS